MAFFLPSYIQKRLLRYALSRIQLFDTDALDLDKLDIGLGRRSTVELRDVALRKKELATLLQLPPTLLIENTSVKTLRLTVPADIYASSIVIEVDGVQISARVDETAAADKNFSRRSSKTNRKRARNDASNVDEDTTLPTPEDLAKSFLEQEPEQEKEELRAELNTQSINLQQSNASLEAPEDGSGYGTGGTGVLPAFLAGFLAGVTDRLQLTIANVEVRLSVDLETPEAVSSHSGTDEAPNSVEVCLQIDEVEIQGVTAHVKNTAPTKESQTEQHVKVGKREIALRGLRSSIAGDRALLEDLLPTPRRDVKTQASSVRSWPQNLDDVSMSRSADSLAATPASDVDESSPQTPIDHSDLMTFSASLASSAGDIQASYNSLASGNMADAETESSASPEDESRYLHRLRRRAVESNNHDVSQSSVQNALNSFRQERRPLTDRRLQRRRSPTPTSNHRRQRPFNTLSQRNDSHPEESSPSDPDQSQRVSSSETPTTELAGLAESKVFSHDEAESIYMSVLSDADQRASTWTHRPRAESADGDDQSVNGAQSSIVDRAGLADDQVGRDTYGAHTDRSLQDALLSGANLVLGDHQEDEQPGRQSYKLSHRSTEGLGKLQLDLFEISIMRLWVPGLGPTTEEDVNAESDNMETASEDFATQQSHSKEKKMPGSFSIYSESAEQSRMAVNQRELLNIPYSAKVSMHATTRSQEDTASSKLEADVEELKSSLTLTTFVAISKIAKRLQAVFSSQNLKRGSEPADGSIRESNGTSGLNLSLRMQKIELLVMQHLGRSVYQRNDEGTEEGLRSPVASQTTQLVHIHLRELSLDLDHGSYEQKMNLEAQQCSLDAGQQPVLRFDRSASLRNSIKDTQLLTGKDISLQYKHSQEIREINLNTLPVILEIHATKLNDTLECVGGFSALLDLGSSILSDQTVEPRPEPVEPSMRPRVRFDTGVTKNRSLQSQAKSGLKVNARVGGCSMGLHAGPKSLKARSTAIKIVLRNDNIGAQIDDIRVQGLVEADNEQDQHPLLLLHSLGIKYLSTPEEHDLAKLLSLVTPSKDNFERGDGGILVETLMRQRKNGAALRLSLAECKVQSSNMGIISELQQFISDLSQLGAITKYLPAETRPGMLILGQIRDINARLEHIPSLGALECHLKDFDFAKVSAPSLVAVRIRSLSAVGDTNQELIHPIVPVQKSSHDGMLMCRLIGDDIVPTVELKLMNTCVEYDVEMVMKMSGVSSSPHGVDALAASIVSLQQHSDSHPRASKPRLHASESSSASFNIDAGLKDCSVGLIPRDLQSKGQLVLNDIRVQYSQTDQDVRKVNTDFRKAAMLLVDDRDQIVNNITEAHESQPNTDQLVPLLCKQGYVSVCWLSAATIAVRIYSGNEHHTDGTEVDFDTELFVLESCADSTQTLSDLLGHLQPPPTPVEGQKFQTEVATVEDMMASFTGDGFTMKSHVTNQDLESIQFAADDPYGVAASDLDISHGLESSDVDVAPNDSDNSSIFDVSQELIPEQDNRVPTSNQTNTLPAAMSTGIVPSDMPGRPQEIAAKWDSDRNRYVPVSHSEVFRSPFKLKISNMHIIWNLHDGYDWRRTRDKISDAVHDIEIKSEERRNRHRQLYEDEDEPEPVIDDFLFNSIYVGVPVNQDPRETTRQINRHLDDAVSETASHTTTATDSTAKPNHYRSHRRTRRLKLERSQRHKMAFELSGISVDMFVFPPGEETVSSTDVRIRDFEIFDHVPTSTWKKFATYMRDSGPREDKKPMLHFEICNVKPIPDLLASELVMRVTVLPVRLHVDQDALDFITRFFDFNDSQSKPSGPSGDQPYLQRVEVLPVPVKLDYKPKKVDYASLRSGRTKEFMNFFNLDGADFVLKHAIIYGCSSFAKLHTNLEDIWMPDIKGNQLPTVLSGLNGVRTLVNVGTGVRNLVTIPIQEYKKDGRIIRSISKGALSFARTSGSEITRFGARLAVGAQSALQGAEDFLVKPRPGVDADWEAEDRSEDEKRAFSYYADQPTGILQGLRGAAKSLERDLLMTRDVVVAVSGEAKESGSIEGAAKAVARHAPTIVLRPMIGASKAVSQTLMGATNSVDPQNRRRLEDKYKRY